MGHPQADISQEKLDRHGTQTHIRSGNSYVIISQVSKLVMWSGVWELIHASVVSQGWLRVSWSRMASAGMAGPEWSWLKWLVSVPWGFPSSGLFTWWLGRVLRAAVCKAHVQVQGQFCCILLLKINHKECGHREVNRMIVAIFAKNLPKVQHHFTMPLQSKCLLSFLSPVIFENLEHFLVSWPHEHPLISHLQTWCPSSFISSRCKVFFLAHPYGELILKILTGLRDSSYCLFQMNFFTLGCFRFVLLIGNKVIHVNGRN